MSEWSEIGWMAHQSVLFIKYYYLFEWKCVLLLLLLPLFLILRFLCCFFFIWAQQPPHSVIPFFIVTAAATAAVVVVIVHFCCSYVMRIVNSAERHSLAGKQAEKFNEKGRKNDRKRNDSSKLAFFPEKSTKSDCVFSATTTATATAVAGY